MILHLHCPRVHIAALALPANLAGRSHWTGVAPILWTGLTPPQALLYHVLRGEPQRQLE